MKKWSSCSSCPILQLIRSEIHCVPLSMDSSPARIMECSCHFLQIFWPDYQVFVMRRDINLLLPVALLLHHLWKKPLLISSHHLSCSLLSVPLGNKLQIYHLIICRSAFVVFYMVFWDQSSLFTQGSSHLSAFLARAATFHAYSGHILFTHPISVDVSIISFWFWVYSYVVCGGCTESTIPKWFSSSSSSHVAPNILEWMDISFISSNWPLLISTHQTRLYFLIDESLVFFSSKIFTYPFH